LPHWQDIMTIALTVEDEFLISEYLSGILIDAGYDVIATANADEAIAILEQRNDIRLVITDINMPGSMDGLKLAAAVKGRWPPINIIIATGKGRPRDDQMPAEAEFLPKPYMRKQVLAAVRLFDTSKETHFASDKQYYRKQ
jgi:two-component system, response regulator PdtaR